MYFLLFLENEIIGHWLDQKPYKGILPLGKIY